MALSFASFQAYEAAYAGANVVSSARYEVLITEATAWASAAFELADVTIPDADPQLTQYEYAQYAYILKTNTITPTQVNAGEVKEVKHGGVTMKLVSSADAKAQDAALIPWFDRAYGHLYKAGLPKPQYATAVMV